MNLRLSASLAGLIIASGIGYAAAQTLVIAPEQETIIREYVTTHEVEPIDPGIDFDITVGSIVPDTVEVHAIQAPELEAEYQYVVVENRTVVVEPETRKIVHIIE